MTEKTDRYQILEERRDRLERGAEGGAEGVGGV
jgi:hypothetical protein